MFLRNRFWIIYFCRREHQHLLEPWWSDHRRWEQRWCGDLHRCQDSSLQGGGAVQVRGEWDLLEQRQRHVLPHQRQWLHQHPEVGTKQSVTPDSPTEFLCRLSVSSPNFTNSWKAVCALSPESVFTLKHLPEHGVGSVFFLNASFKHARSPVAAC